MNIDLPSAILSLTGALDFVGIDEVHHGKRVALMAASIAERLGWEQSRVDDLLMVGMIHNCGVSRAREYRRINETLEWDGAHQHCLRGERFLRDCTPFARFAPIVRWHHTRWESLPQEGLSAFDRLATNLIFLGDRTDVLFVKYLAGVTLKSEILWEYPAIVAQISALSGTLFSPELVRAFEEVALRESFWLALDPSYIEDEIIDRVRAIRPAQMSSDDARAIARLFAQTADAKSMYTLEHSTRVAEIARYLAEVSGHHGAALDQIEIAGLLHDVGKLRLPEEVIDKPSELTREERALIRRHSYDTARILNKVFPGEPIADWASLHHENLLGTGYPYHSRAADIPREARLISVADIFQALAQERPYRKRLGANDVLTALELMRSQGRIDGEMVALLRANLERCYALAVGEA